VSRRRPKVRARLLRVRREVVELHVGAGNVRGEEGVRSGAGPVACELQVQTTALADLFCQWPSIARVDGVTLRFDAPSMERVVRTLNCLSAMSFVLR